MISVYQPLKGIDETIKVTGPNSCGKIAKNILKDILLHSEKETQDFALVISWCERTSKEDDRRKDTGFQNKFHLFQYAILLIQIFASFKPLWGQNNVARPNFVLLIH